MKPADIHAANAALEAMIAQTSKQNQAFMELVASVPGGQELLLDQLSFLTAEEIELVLAGKPSDAVLAKVLAHTRASRDNRSGQGESAHPE